MRKIFDEYGWAEAAPRESSQQTPGLRGASALVIRVKRRTSSHAPASMRPLVARTSEELMDLLAARGMCQPDKPLPPKIRVEGEPMLFPLDLSHIPSEYRFNERGPLAFVDARNIDFGRATLVSDWSHALFAQSNLSDATLAGSFYRLFMDGVFLNPRQFDRLSAHR